MPNAVGVALKRQRQRPKKRKKSAAQPKSLIRAKVKKADVPSASFRWENHSNFVKSEMESGN